MLLELLFCVGAYSDELSWENAPLYALNSFYALIEGNVEVEREGGGKEGI